MSAGKPVQLTEHESFADSLGGGIGLHNRYSFEVLRRVMDQSYLVDEAAIARAMVHFVEQEKMLVEGAAVVGVAAIEQHRLDVRGRKVVFVVSGHNVALETFDKARALAAKAR